MTKLFTCLKGHEWELKLRRPSHASDNWVACPVWGGRRDDPPVDLAEPPPPPEPVPEPTRRSEEGSKGGLAALPLFIGLVVGLAVAGGVGYLVVRNTLEEAEETRMRL